MKIKTPKEKGFLYDAADVYWPSSKRIGCKSFDDAVYHLKFLLEWLNSKNQLNEDAKEILNLSSLPKNFELRSWMLKDEANKALPQVYEKWIKKIKIGQKQIDMKILEDALKSKK